MGEDGILACMKMHAYTCEGAGDEECPGDADQLELQIEEHLSNLKGACLHTANSQVHKTFDF